MKGHQSSTFLGGFGCFGLVSLEGVWIDDYGTLVRIVQMRRENASISRIMAVEMSHEGSPNNGLYITVYDKEFTITIISRMLWHRREKMMANVKKWCKTLTNKIHPTDFARGFYPTPPQGVPINGRLDKFSASKLFWRLWTAKQSFANVATILDGGLFESTSYHFLWSMKCSGSTIHAFLMIDSQSVGNDVCALASLVNEM